MKLSKITCSLTLALALLLSFSPNAFASYVTSDNNSMTVKNITYSYHATGGTTPYSQGCYVSAGTIITSSSLIPTGYAGAIAQLYTSDGQLIVSSSWNYNSEDTTSVSASQSTFVASATDYYYYSQGWCQFYNGNGYTPAQTFRTPNFMSGANATGFMQTEAEYVNPKTGSSYNTNKMGVTYCSALQATSYKTLPELILAKGINGHSGYVLKADLFQVGLINCPDEASRLGTNVSKRIPLYESDGITVIDSFLVGGNE